LYVLAIVVSVLFGCKSLILFCNSSILFIIYTFHQLVFASICHVISLIDHLVLISAIAFKEEHISI